MKKTLLAIIISGTLAGVSCNKKSGCGVTEAAHKMVNISDDKKGSFGGKKAKKAPKSSVMPAEIRYKKK